MKLIVTLDIVLQIRLNQTKIFSPCFSFLKCSCYSVNTLSIQTETDLERKTATCTSMCGINFCHVLSVNKLQWHTLCINSMQYVVPAIIALMKMSNIFFLMFLCCDEETFPL